MEKSEKGDAGHHPQLSENHRSTLRRLHEERKVTTKRITDIVRTMQQPADHKSYKEFENELIQNTNTINSLTDEFLKVVAEAGLTQEDIARLPDDLR